jgi:hypothetical protein
MSKSVDTVAGSARAACEQLNASDPTPQETREATVTIVCEVCQKPLREIPASQYLGIEDLCDEHADEYGSL